MEAHAERNCWNWTKTWGPDCSFGWIANAAEENGQESIEHDRVDRYCAANIWPPRVEWEMAQRSTGSRLATTTNYMHSQTAAQLCVQHCRMNVLMKWPMLTDVPHQRPWIISMWNQMEKALNLWNRLNANGVRFPFEEKMVDLCNWLPLESQLIRPVHLLMMVTVVSGRSDDGFLRFPVRCAIKMTTAFPPEAYSAGSVVRPHEM